MNARYRASGPGAKTRDGCSVELYLKLPYRGEVDLLKPWVPRGASVLELGCGVGRMTRALLAEGYRVTAVDNSEEMLAHVPIGASKVISDIENLELVERFDAVVLASCLVNVPEEALRFAQLANCRRHLRPEGRLLFERHDPIWLSHVAAGHTSTLDMIDISVTEASHRGEEVDLCVRYHHAGESWLQCFTARILDDDGVANDLARAGFEPPTWLNRRWAVAKPAGVAA
jgi:SAM-dependent methyltransferase